FRSMCRPRSCGRTRTRRPRACRLGSGRMRARGTRSVPWLPSWGYGLLVADVQTGVLRVGVHVRLDPNGERLVRRVHGLAVDLDERDGPAFAFEPVGRGILAGK